MMRKLDCNSSISFCCGSDGSRCPCIGPLLKVWRCQIQSGIWWKDRRWFKFVDLNTSVVLCWVDQCGSMESLSIGNSLLWEAIEHTASSVCRCANLRTRPRHAQWSRCAGTQPFGPTCFFEKQCISQNITCRGQRCPISGSTSKNLMTRLEDLMMRMSRQRVLNILQNNFHPHRIHV